MNQLHTKLRTYLSIASSSRRGGRRIGDGRHLVLEEALPISLILGKDLVLGLVDCSGGSLSLGRELLAKDAAGRGLLLVLPVRLGGIDRSDGDSRNAKCGRGNDELHFVDFVWLTFHVALFNDVILLDKVRQSRECSSKQRYGIVLCAFFKLSLMLARLCVFFFLSLLA